MSAFGHQERQVDAIFGEVRQGGVAQLMQRPRGLADLQRVLLEEVGVPLPKLLRGGKWRPAVGRWFGSRPRTWPSSEWSRQLGS